MHKRKDVLTTGQVAEICNVAPRTVTKWFDSGQLKGYRIPGSRDRRIPTSELVRFMKAHDIPTDSLEAGQIRVLLIDTDKEQVDRLVSKLHAKDSYDVKTAHSNFDAGIAAQKMVPHVIMINLMAEGIDSREISRYVRANEELDGARLVAIARNIGRSEQNALSRQGFDAVITDPDNVAEVIGVIQDVTAIIY